MAKTIEQQQSEEPELKCNPQLAEVSQPVNTSGGCSGSYTIETPLLVSGWKNATASVVSSDCGCGAATTVNGTKVNVALSGSRPNPCPTLYQFKVTQTVCTVGSSPTCNTTTGGFALAPLGSKPTGTVRQDSSGVATSWYATCERTDGTTFEILVADENEPSFQITNVSIGSVQKVNESDPECFDCRVTVKYEGCSETPSGGYDPSNPPPGGSPPSISPPSGSPPSSPPQSNPPPRPPSGGFPPPSGGNNPPPPAAPPPSPPPRPPDAKLSLLGSPYVIPAGVDPSYPSGVTLYPQPSIYNPSLTAIFPGGEIVAIPWNGYLTWFGALAGTTIVSGNNFPAWYVSPMMSQKVFDNWKVLKHATIQFENVNTEIHTSKSTNDTLLYGKAQQLFDANLALLYNDQHADQTIYDLYRYDNGRWTLQLYPRHGSPKSIDKFVVFKEPLQGVANSYQIAIHSSDPYTWKLVGWQIEGKLKGKRTGHSRD